jgi:UDP-3-O-[3-hydroxymyristoyl] glucosamine N-acyltransferase
VIGSDGFRFNPENDHKKVPQIGNVVVEDDVEIGANCAIDRATLGSTILRKGVKFDNLIHIAHNVEIGENTYFAAHGVVAGSTKIGKNCMFSGQVGIVGHLNIADNTIITAQSGISKSIAKKGEVFMGSPAFDANKYRKAYIHFRNLDSLVQRLDKIEKFQKEAEPKEI